MAKQHPYELEGVVAEIVSGSKYRVLLKNKRKVLAGLCNRTRFDRDRMGIGDKVIVRTRSDESEGACIVYRRNEPSRFLNNAN